MQKCTLKKATAKNRYCLHWSCIFRQTTQGDKNSLQKSVFRVATYRATSIKTATKKDKTETKAETNTA
ncbi:MAG: hypothetical protein FWF54_05335 [Candidatus Azobacteroides sp.]|nr:hypothetical protein [Candidatus Azobacteroides sp.]